MLHSPLHPPPSWQLRDYPRLLPAAVPQRRLGSALASEAEGVRDYPLQLRPESPVRDYPLRVYPLVWTYGPFGQGDPLRPFRERTVQKEPCLAVVTERTQPCAVLRLQEPELSRV